MNVLKVQNSSSLKNVDSESVSTVNWQQYDYQPKVTFKISHSNEAIHLRFDVEEDNILALETNTNGEVYKDSCVEFFITFDDQHYYNFEFNCIGTRYIAYGATRNNRKKLNPEIVEKISANSTLGSEPFKEKKGDFKWSLDLEIPKICFAYTDIKSFSKQAARANFYKCGDSLSKPHFLTWKPINTVNPDFHQIDFLHPIYFE